MLFRSRIIDTAYNDTLALLSEKREVLERLAQKLLEKEKIDAPEFEAVYNNVEFVPAKDKAEKIPEAEEIPAVETVSEKTTETEVISE